MWSLGTGHIRYEASLRSLPSHNNALKLLQSIFVYPTANMTNLKNHLKNK
ncbi:Protein of unknown function [Pyronema omphalodes CBS 100304]|uniref:Uncharacterized protein n=1 Tax=Pyronema omphalodes (strain CBS 100304) TaxID=1076935 RepID=U4LBU9_PYROM|nr:Protein of unknown function [Pyronema omphalodes CBS 100304]